MEVFRSLFQYVKAWLLILLEFLKLRLIFAVDKDLEIIALRSQLALFNHQVETGKRPKPKATPVFRQLWVLISRCYAGWRNCLISFKPETVISMEGYRVFFLLAEKVSEEGPSGHRS